MRCVSIPVMILALVATSSVRGQQPDVRKAVRDAVTEEREPIREERREAREERREDRREGFGDRDLGSIRDAVREAMLEDRESCEQAGAARRPSIVERETRLSPTARRRRARPRAAATAAFPADLPMRNSIRNS